MGFQVKVGGGYADAAAIFAKKNGTYQAVQGVFAKAAGAYQQVDTPPWSPAVRLTGSAFTAAQIAPGVAGSYDLVTNANRVYLSAALGNTLTGGAHWCAWIKGTGATLVIPNDYSNYPAAIAVSVDGAAFSNAANTSSTYTLFTGLSDTVHYVVVRVNAAWANAAYFNESGGNILTLTGTDTYVDLCEDWVYAGVSNALSVAAGMTVSNTANFTPNKSKYNIYSGVSNVGAARIRGVFQKIIVSANGPSGMGAAYVSKNGAAPTKHSLSFSPGAGGYAAEITGLSGLATYTCWPDTGGAILSVAGDAQHVDIGSKKQIHQFGDSITNGGMALIPGEVDVLRVGAAMGFAGLTVGVGGQTIQGLDTALPTYLAAMTVTSADVAILAIGRNNTGAAFDATETTAYQNIITNLVAKGYGKIICRGILPSGDHTLTWPDENNSISSIVSGVGNADVVYCAVTACPTYSTYTSDNVHPDATGYGVIATYVEPLYRTILGL